MLNKKETKNNIYQNPDNWKSTINVSKQNLTTQYIYHIPYISKRQPYSSTHILYEKVAKQFVSSSLISVFKLPNIYKHLLLM